MSQLSIFIVMLAALLVPLMMAHFQVSNMPTAIAEILIGIVIGQSGFNIVHMNSTLNLLSSLGVIVLIFLSGMEINFDLFKRQPGQKSTGDSPVKIAALAFGSIFVMAILLGLALRVTGMFNGVMLATIIFSSIALGVVIATLKEKEILSRPIGQTVLLTAVLGEVIPMLMLTVYASIHGGHAGRLWLIVLLFIAAIILLRRFRQPYQWFNQVTKSTTQLDVRLAFFLIFTLVTVATTVGAENILGAFLAGMVMKLLKPEQSTEDKLTSIGYGFFIPIFFISTGIRLNLRSLITNPRALVLIPIFVLCFLLAKLVSTIIYLRRFSRHNSLAAAFLCATTITLVLPTLTVARNLHAITATQQDAFILGAVIVCICGPIMFNVLFKATKEDLIKQRVVILGVNVWTVPITQQLTTQLYDIRMVTDNQKDYKTYNSEVPDITYLDQINESSLLDGKFFDTDVLVVGFREDERNFAIAQIAKKHGVKRVIMSQMSNEHDFDSLHQLVEQGIEIFNPYNVQSSMLRALIESPAMMDILTDTEHGIFEITVKNRRYTGINMDELPMIDQITISRIKRNGEWLTPHGDTVINEGDQLFVTASYDDIGSIQSALSRTN
ncbi:cation:proton antiporter [Limosilactobacillus sp.]|uniref:cation:proton antiporter domain-containing protein n=1 Tax=Limosilactobacillus sp. TaxID=2773925 RepID=UPI00345E65F4